MSWQPSFPIIRCFGILLNHKWKYYRESFVPVAVHGRLPEHVHGGWARALSSAGARLTRSSRRKLGYAVKAVAKMQRKRIKSMEIKREAIADFDELINVRVCAMEGGEGVVRRGLTVSALCHDRDISRRYVVVSRASDQLASEDGGDRVWRRNMVVVQTLGQHGLVYGVWPGKSLPDYPCIDSSL